MKPMMLISILLILVTNVYVAWRVFHVMPTVTWCRWTVVGVMMALSVALPVLFMVGFDSMPMPLAKLFYALTTSWLFIFLYLLMTFLALDILRLTHLMPADWLQGSWRMSLGITAFLLALFVGGNIHYNHKYRVPLRYTTDKPLTKPLKVVMASDLHLGYHNGRGELARWVDMINAERPDIVLIAGDIIDISVRPLLDENMAEELRRIQVPVVACMGNHEYFATEPKAVQFIDDAGITLLQDSAMTWNDCLTIIGRDDRTNPDRKPLAELMKQADKSHYTILLDHQPYHLEEAQQCGIDLQLSGHTHRGQVWPVSWITDAIYEQSHGPLTKGTTQYYVSSGIGIWGGKFRIGTRSEYVVIDISPVK